MSTPTTESLSLSLLNSHGDPYSDLEDRGSISDDSASDDDDLSDAEKGASPSSKRAGSYGTNALGMSHLAPPYTPPMSPAPGGTRQGLEEKEMREKTRKASALPAGGKHHRRRSSAAPATAEKHVDWMRGELLSICLSPSVGYKRGWLERGGGDVTYDVSGRVGRRTDEQVVTGWDEDETEQVGTDSHFRVPLAVLPIWILSVSASLLRPSLLGRLVGGDDN
jgi:hypothetical protein